MNKKQALIAISVIIIIAVGGYFLFADQKSPANQYQENSLDGSNEGSPAENDAMESSGTLKVFDISGTNFDFSQTTLRVKKGDTVRINFSVTQGFHDWVLDEFNAKTSQMQAGGQETIEFVADRAGEFEYYCSVGQHRQMGMVGTLIVEE